MGLSRISKRASRVLNESIDYNFSVDFLFGALVLASPFVLVAGWVLFFKLPDRSGWRNRVSLLGLCAPIVSFAIWIAMVFFVSHLKNAGVVWPEADSTVLRLEKAGMLICLIGTLLGFISRPRLILPIVMTCIACLFFWVGTTIP